MHLQLSANNFELGPHIKKLVQTKFQAKLEKHLSRLDSPDLDVSLHISRDKDGVHTISSSLDLPGPGGQIASKTSDLELVVALKKAVDQLIRQISRFKDN